MEVSNLHNMYVSLPIASTHGLLVVSMLIICLILIVFETGTKRKKTMRARVMRLGHLLTIYASISIKNPLIMKKIRMV